MLVLASASPRRRELLTQAGFSFEVHPAHIPEDPYPSEDPIAYVTRLAREKAQFVFRELTKCRDTTSKAVEKPSSVKGTGFGLKGTGFSPCASPAESSRALAPEGTRSPGAPPFLRTLRKGWDTSILAPQPDSTLIVLGADTTVTLDNRILGKPSDPGDAARILRLLSGRTHQVITGVALVTAQSTEVASEITAVCFLTLSNDEIASYVATGEPMDKAGAYAIQGRAARWIPRIEGDYFNVVGLPIALVANLLESRQHPATPSY